MTDNKVTSAATPGRTTLVRVARLCTSISIGVLGILFIAFAAHLYFTGGTHPYSRERVGRYLLPLAIPSAITVGLSIWSFVLTLKEGARENESAKLSSIYRLSAYAKRFNESEIKEEQHMLIKKERRTRTLVNSLFFSVSAILLLCAFLYLIIFAEFTVENLNGDMMAAFAVCLPLLALSVGVHVPRLYLNEKSAERERLAFTVAAKDGIKPTGSPSPKEYKNEALAKRIGGVAVLTVAVVFIVIGIFNGGMGDVLAKAVKICTECIGLG